MIIQVGASRDRAVHIVRCCLCSSIFVLARLQGLATVVLHHCRQLLPHLDLVHPKLSGVNYKGVYLHEMS